MKIKILASGSAGNCYWVSDGKTDLLLEAGIPLREIQKGCGFNLSGIAGCLVTHEHNDHAKAGADVMKRGVDVYASQGTAEAKGWRGHRLHTVKSMQTFTIGTFTIMAFDLVHDVAEPLGFIINSHATQEKLLYVTDTHFIKYRFSGLTHIMSECNYDNDILINRVRSGEVEPFLAKRIINNHMSIDTVEALLRANDLSHLRQIYLLHLSGDNSDAGAFKERVQRLTGVEVYA
jgi:phosphoribosyl 1,2-cyclic phosphodiesterase